MRRLFPPPTPPPPPLLIHTLGMFSNTDAVVGMQLNAHKGLIQSYVWISRNGNYFSALVCYSSFFCSVFFMFSGRPPWKPLYEAAYIFFSLRLGWNDAMWKLLLVTEIGREARRRFQLCQLCLPLVMCNSHLCLIYVQYFQMCICDFCTAAGVLCDWRHLCGRHRHISLRERQGVSYRSRKLVSAFI